MLKLSTRDNLALSLGQEVVKATRGGGSSVGRRILGGYSGMDADIEDLES